MTSDIEDQNSPSSEDGGAADAPVAAPAYSGPTPGQILKAERERQNLSIEDVVSQSRMTMDTVRALEEDRDPPQNAWVYVRGYYRKYARVLGLSEEDILHAHEQVAGGAPAPQPLSTEWAPQDVSPGSGIPKVVFVLVAGMILGGLAWVFLPGMIGSKGASEAADKQPTASVEEKGSESDTPSKARSLFSPGRGDTASEPSANAGEAPSTAAESVAVTADEPAEQAEAGQVADEDASAVSESEDATAAVEEVTAGSVHDAGMASDGPRLGVEFTDRSWVNIVDATGRKLLDGIVQEGAQFALKGEAPYRVFLGYAPGVKMSYGGEMINLEPYISSNNTARFKVGDAGSQTP